MKINVLKNTILFCKAIQKDIELAGKKKISFGQYFQRSCKWKFCEL
jgi:hypothetical protein